LSINAVFDSLKYNVEIYPDGARVYSNNLGQLHREDGPAIEYPNGTKLWYQNNLLHREDGPAIEWASGTREWWLNGVLYSRAKHKRMLGC
jgi:hypothetical protein